jgi:hypothetical protein
LVDKEDVKVLIVSFLFAFLFHATLWGAEKTTPLLDVRVNDYKPWSYEQTDRIVAIGDIHGDFDALIRILLDNNVINEKGEWIGGTAQVVQIGDLIDRGPHSRIILDFMIQLEKEARFAGGAVFCLIGNHEMMVSMGDFRYTDVDEMLGFFPHLPSDTPREDVLPHYRKLMTSDNRYTRWTRTRRTVLRIGDTLFVHAGFSENFLEMTPEKINATVKRYLEVLHNAPEQGPIDNPEVDWLFRSDREDSPLWTRKLAKGEVDEKVLHKILKHYNVERVVIGHSQLNTPDVKVGYDGLIYNLDSGNSIGYGGNLRSITWLRNQDPFILNSIRPVQNYHYLQLKEKFPCFAAQLSQLL